MFEFISEKRLADVIDPASEEGKQLSDLYQKDNLLRGAYLIQAIWIEELLRGIISLSLCPNEDLRSLFRSLILNHREFTFDGKFMIFKRLLELKYPSIVKEYEDVFKQIREVIQFRNKLAHCMLDATDGSWTKSLQIAFNYGIMIVKDTCN